MEQSKFIENIICEKKIDLSLSLIHTKFNEDNDDLPYNKLKRNGIYIRKYYNESRATLKITRKIF